MAFILIVEDSDDITPLEIALGSLDGLATKIVKDGRDALEVIRNESREMAALITDLNLPFNDGFELIAAARWHSQNARLPIIVLSGNSDPATQTRTRGLGANAFFTKPYSPAAVRHTLKGLLDAL